MSISNNGHRHKGHVKFFNSIKGFGFIIPDSNKDNDSIEEVFVHHTAIFNNGGFKNLAEGEEVEYDLVLGPKGMQAANVTGPDGVSVKGDPNRYHRPTMYSSYNQYYYDNRGQTGEFAVNSSSYDGSSFNCYGTVPFYPYLYSPQSQMTLPYNAAAIYPQQPYLNETINPTITTTTTTNLNTNTNATNTNGQVKADNDNHSFPL
ncbi:cold-shock' DNA-binding domain-containing protein [Cokeromyces recurvatus]|uniref:cold-shock' DNA-binding domain-containing protein n=1 Tax=Cokeromyces recurvatus TaxID=90255 RepID=UPI00221F0544|nr:cold-shock' DNA-binding domain-containing protein [Cokeromyces recurvatus]KAI7903936.1 cold-shock' DNA-binding domain-containing protein [Cokeromyces recurvatus]